VSGGWVVRLRVASRNYRAVKKQASFRRSWVSDPEPAILWPALK
jgi:hypothetical protein